MAAVEKFLKERLHAPSQKTAIICGSLVLLFVVWKIVRYQILSTFTAVPDLRYLRKSRSAPKLKGTCFIAGGSISGLLAASVASKHYEKVIMVRIVLKSKVVTDVD
jgi:hypothetical protein